jgi:hypothetical protein
MAHQDFFTTVKIIILNFLIRENYYYLNNAGVAELADAPDLGSGAARRGGSTPFTRTKFFYDSKINKVFCASKITFHICGSSSVVEYNLAKVGVAGSNPVFRSKSS